MPPATVWSPIGSMPHPAGGVAKVSTRSVLAIITATPKKAWNGTGTSSSRMRVGWLWVFGHGSCAMTGPKNSSPVTTKCASMNWCPAGLPISRSNSGVK
jgi:hypothetical protein